MNATRMGCGNGRLHASLCPFWGQHLGLSNGSMGEGCGLRAGQATGSAFFGDGSIDYVWVRVGGG